MIFNPCFNPHVLGGRIKEIRKQEGQTQQEFADHYGTQRTVVSYWENGRRTPNLETIVRMATENYISLDYLLGVSSIKHEPRLK